MKEAGLPYEIRIEGHLAPRRLRHFEGVTVRQEASGETVIEGCFRDQAALYGLLSWLQRLGATLLLVKRLQDPSPSSGPTSAGPDASEPCCASWGRG
jgi:hypothetical protein